MIAIAFICFSCTNNNNNTYSVFHSFTLNGHNYGVSEVLSSPTSINWNAQVSSSSNVLSIYIPYKERGSSDIYDWIIIYIDNPTLGFNDATLTKAGDCETLNSALSSNFKINLTKLASGPGDYYEGSFSGGVGIINLCLNPPGINTHSSSGSFKVYRQ